MKRTIASKQARLEATLRERDDAVAFQAATAEVLAANGYTRLSHLDGDMNAWMANARPVEAKAPPEAAQH